MARCKLTSMNLRTIRKSKEYQALLIDLVAVGIVGQSAAEGILGYTIPAGLLGSAVTDDDTEPSGESGGESGGSVVNPNPGESGGGLVNPGLDDGGEVPPESNNTVTLLYYLPSDGHAAPEWLTAEYDLTDDLSGTGILAFAKDAFNDDTINNLFIAVQNPEYDENESDLIDKYTSLDPQPDTLEPGSLIVAAYPDNNVESPIADVG